ncbi:transmembrane protein, putative (macronuclear) [Tetrahymena thermophila SB210]|uniref:Transmembrane protein, putative n=1 Tax=Tetrahymena thermophila (strain SB210) TaxID=312017 RepID=W7XKK1_TETTS|nr:transmembrane protein, putative [Tetrahymena thermophila SB210]EWS74969.1 transmembrane protein, putative [Tetrahymena thermophila SB210]|eukprot:XP_012652510.1 transmembrane protein, putative [Tetrahymena thermophila SB210]
MSLLMYKLFEFVNQKNSINILLYLWNYSLLLSICSTFTNPFLLYFQFIIHTKQINKFLIVKFNQLFQQIDLLHFYHPSNKQTKNNLAFLQIARDLSAKELTNNNSRLLLIQAPEAPTITSSDFKIDLASYKLVRGFSLISNISLPNLTAGVDSLLFSTFLILKGRSRVSTIFVVPVAKNELELQIQFTLSTLMPNLIVCFRSKLYSDSLN